MRRFTVLWLVILQSVIGGTTVAFASTNTSDNVNSAYVFAGATIRLTNIEDVYSTQTSYKGFEVGSIPGRNQGIDTISWTTAWYACDQRTDFKATDADYLNATNDQVADQAALDSLLVAAGCSALPSSGGFALTNNSQSFNPRPRYDFEDFDATGKQYISAKITAAVTSEITVYAITDGFDRPTITSPQVQISGSGAITFPSAVTEGDFRTLSRSFILCPTSLNARNDISYVTSENLFAAANCTNVYSSTGTLPTNSNELFEERYVGPNVFYDPIASVGYLHFVTSLDSVVYDVTAGINVASAPPAPAPYVGPIPVSFSVSCIPAGVESTAVLSGERLNTITSAEVDGKPITVSEVSASSVKLALPALTAGTYSVVYNSSSGRLTHQASLRVCATSAVQTQPGQFTAQRLFANYRGDRGPVIARDRAAITSFIRQYSGITTVRCVGSTSGVPAKRTDPALAQARAKNACDIVKRLVPNATISLETSTGKGIGQRFRSVTIFISGTN